MKIKKNKVLNVLIVLTLISFMIFCSYIFIIFKNITKDNHFVFNLQEYNEYLDDINHGYEWFYFIEINNDKIYIESKRYFLSIHKYSDFLTLNKNDFILFDYNKTTDSCPVGMGFILKVK